MLGAAAVLLAAGCGAPQVRDHEPAPSAPPPPGQLSVSAPRPAEGVSTMGPICADDQAERCDALDSDCDGKIDEGCEGAVQGAVVVAAVWNSGVDLELSVDGPPGTEPSARQSGHGDCADGGVPIDGVAYDAPEPGSYRVSLRQANACDSEGTTTASVTVSVNDHVLGIFNRTVDGSDAQEVVAFDLTR